MYVIRRWATRNARIPLPPRDHAINGTSAWLRINAGNFRGRSAAEEHLVTEIILESGVLKNRIINPEAAGRIAFGRGGDMERLA